MTTIQNTTLRVTATAVRAAVVTLLALTGVALLVITMANTSGSITPSHVLSAMPTVSLSTYFIALGSYIGAVALTGARENARAAEKTQFDIR